MEVQLSRQKAEFEKAQKMIEKANKLLEKAELLMYKSSNKKKSFYYSPRNSNDEKSTGGDFAQIVEGIYDGQYLIDKNKRKFNVPENYASKSKLVEGDILKLIITSDGSFIFKQIEPIEREKKLAKIKRKNNNLCAYCDGKYYNLLKASLSYFKAKEGDEATIIVAKNNNCKHAALENIIPC